MTVINLKQIKCPRVEEYLINLWHIYSLEYYAVIKKNNYKDYIALRIMSQVKKLEIKICILHDCNYVKIWVHVDMGNIQKG